MRNLAGFARFLPLAALCNGQELNKASLARNAGIGRTTVEEYFSILEDCQMGFFLPGYESKLGVRERQNPKWIWHDPGILRGAKGNFGEVIEEEKGALFQSWVLTTIRARQEYFQDVYEEMYYWTPLENKQCEVDCLLRQGREFCAIEIKSSTRYRKEMLKGLQAISALSGIKKRLLVYQGAQDLPTEDGIEVITVPSFLHRLETGIFG